MTKTQLAKELGISRQMVHRLIKRGMPCDSVESARRWRGSYLFGFLTKGVRIDGNTGLSHTQAIKTGLEVVKQRLLIDDKPRFDLITEWRRYIEESKKQTSRISSKLLVTLHHVLPV